MKSLILIFSLIFNNPTIFANGHEQLTITNNRVDTITIVTTAQCSMCTHRIEETLTFERGVRSAKLDLETGIVKVVYHNGRTNPDNIRKSISKVGYDADDIKADPDAYDKLPGCCRKPDDPGYYKHN